jgi:hypothetical protein
MSSAIVWDASTLARYGLTAAAPPTPPPSADAIPPRRTLDEWSYVTLDDLAADTRRLAELLPDDVDAIVAIPRSGLLAAGPIAAALHLPLFTVTRADGVRATGSGFRMENRPEAPPRRVALIDDTVAHGYALAWATPLTAAAFPGAALTRAVVYAHPLGLHAVDLYAAVYPGGHYLEWNWPNAGHAERCAFDFDGILCADCPPEADDDGPRYRHFLATARRRFLPRRAPVRLIVTARHERYRDLTLAWLAREGVRVDRLVMRDWDLDPAVPFNDQVAAWKAGHYRESGCPLFAESDPAQARIIADLSRRPVLCPDLPRVLVPAPPREFPDATDAEIAAAIARRDACPHRGPAVSSCGCLHPCALERGPRWRPAVAGVADCLRCQLTDPPPTVASRTPRSARDWNPSPAPNGSAPKARA